MTIQTPIQSEFKVWFTAQEMADAAECGLLQGVPASRQGVNDLARRENWHRYHALVKSEKGRGGTITRYHLDLLPIDIRLPYLRKFVQADQDDLRVPGALEAGLSERAWMERSARMIVVRLADKFKRLNRLTVMASDHMFTLTFNGGKVEGLPEWVRETIGSLSVRSIQRWRSSVRNNDGLALAHDPADARAGTGLLETAHDGRVRRHILAWIAEAPAMAAAVVRDQVIYEFGSELPDRHGEMKPMPNERAYRYYMAHLREAEKAVILAYSNPDGYRSRMKLRGRNAYRHVSRPNQMWMIDASPVDALCVDGRWNMYACIDVATRRFIITFSRTPRAEAVALLIRRAILEWGVPDVIKTDNGSDFVAAATVRLMNDLNIAADTSQAYSPAEKGIVERAIKTFQHEVAPQLPGYIGHNVAERKAIESKKSFAQRLGADERELFEVSMTIEELRAWTDDWLTYIYNEDAHGGLNGISPNVAAERSAERPRRVDERALDALLMPVVGNNGRRKMGPQGIRTDNRFFMTAKVLVGTDVFCRYHPDDMGRLYVYSVDGREFLDVATDPQFSGVNPAEFAKAIIAEGNAVMAERLKDVKAEVRRIKKGPAAIARSIAVAKQRMADRTADTANVIQLPKTEKAHVTPQIAAALDAATLPELRSKPAPMTEPLAALMAAVEADLAPQPSKGNVRSLRAEATPQQRFRAAQEIERGLASGQQIEAERLLWLGSYREGAEYKTQKGIWEEFGDQAPVLRT